MSIISLMNRVDQGDIVLPNIQRSFVWDPEAISKLMDSIMRGYPIGIILMWDTHADIQYRKFTTNYVAESAFDFSSNKNEKKLLLVLDGQQRLQSLYIALYGKYNGRKLYFELLSGESQDNTAEMKYDFEFLTEKEAKKRNDESIVRFQNPENDDPSTDHEKWFWFPVSDLFQMEYDDLQNLLDELHERIRIDRSEKKLIERNVNYLKENFQQNEHILKHSILDENKPPTSKSRKSVADILEVFVRVNREGTRLSKSDLIFSMLKLNWSHSAIELPQFVERLNSKTNFSLDKDFVIKCLFTVSGFGPKYDLDILRKKSNVDILMKNYDSCCKAIEKCLDFVQHNCWIRSRRTLPGYNLLIPFVYYIYRLPGFYLPDSEIAKVRKFFYIAALTRLFTRYADTRIRVFVRDYLRPGLDKGKVEFPLCDGVAFLRRYTGFEGIDEEILQQSGNAHLIMNIVQRDFDMSFLCDRNNPDIDHIFPKSKLRELGIAQHLINHYANYWYFPKERNQRKSNKHPRAYFKEKGVSDELLRRAFIDHDLLDFPQYITFIKTRSSKILAHILSTLEISPDEFQSNKAQTH